MYARMVNYYIKIMVDDQHSILRNANIHINLYFNFSHFSGRFSRMVIRKVELKELITVPFPFC